MPARLSILLPALALGAAPGPGAAAEAPGPPAPEPIALAVPRSDPGLELLAPGVALWLDYRLRDAGLRPLRDAAPARPEALLQAAAERGAPRALLPELRGREGEAEVVLALYDTGAGEIAALGRARAPLAELGAACFESLARLLPALGVAPPTAGPPGLDELAAVGRALGLARRGEPGRAWQELEGKLSPTALRLREELGQAAQSPDAPPLERARLLAGSGDPLAAWRLVAEDVARELRSATPRASSLAAAAEIQLARRSPREAGALAEAALRADPANALAALVLGRALALQGDAAAARRELERAAALDAGSPAPLELLAEAGAAEPPRQARLLLAAGRLAGARLDVRRAERLFARAAGLAPELAAQTWRARAELHAALGQPHEAALAFRSAVEAGAADAELWLGLARAERRQGEAGAAESSLRRALAREPRHPELLSELGRLYAEFGRGNEAVPVLEQALATGAAAPEARRALALALRETGALGRARELLTAAPATGQDATALSELARLEKALGHPAEAREALRRAIALEPHDAGLRAQLAEVYEADGDPGAAAARSLSDLLAGEAPAARAAPAEGAGAPALDALVQGFAGGGGKRGPSGFLGLRPVGGARELLLRTFHPRIPDAAALEAALAHALARRFELRPLPEHELRLLEGRLAGLWRFGGAGSLDPAAIAAANLALDTNAVFLARLRVGPRPAAEARDGVALPCGGGRPWELELRMLSGREPELASALADALCLGPGLRAWNRRALAAWGLLLLLLGFPALRGWGEVVVRIGLPPKTRGFFSVRVGRDGNDLPLERRARELFLQRLRRGLRRIGRFEQHMVARESVFRWIPARARSYTLTVRGPLFDAMGEDVIGHFLEQREVRVQRGRTSRVEFDFDPKEVAVEVAVSCGGRPAAGARVARQGVPASLRYARDGSSFLYLPKGRHTILVGGRDRVAAVPLEIESLRSAIPLPVDLDAEELLLFRDCPAAVDPWLAGDLPSAAAALAAAGQEEAAHLARAAHLRGRGETLRAAEEFCAAGKLEEAAALRAAGSDHRGAAELFERAGDLARAAETWRAAGDLAAAARCYAGAYLYDEALDCTREVGDAAQVLELLEKTGAWLEAATTARGLGDEARALRSLEQIGAREEAYPEACVLLARILADRGDDERALEKAEEALRVRRGGEPPAELRELHARLRERARPPSPAAPESRYELLGELGRGGMGVVYRARDRRLGRLVALKRLPENLREHPAAVELFRREARAAASLNHPNIVTLYDADEEGGIYFITMELLEGKPLSAILARHGRLGARDVARLGLQVCAGLHYAGERRIVHRDIKTGNLFFTRERVVKIMDFGLAKTLEEVRRSSTVIGGTPTHMAPEQAAGEAVDPRTDLYALGVTLFELLTGELPFGAGDLAWQHRHAPPPDPRGLVPDLPGALSALVLALLAKRPAERPASAAEVGARLQALLAGAA